MKTSDYFKPEFLEELMRVQFQESEIKVHDVTQFAVDNTASILSTLNAGTIGQEIGHFGLEVNYWKGGKNWSKRMVMKVKPHGDVTSAMLRGLSQLSGEPLNTAYEPYTKLTGFQNTHMRELEVYKKLPASIQPEIYGLMADVSNNIFLILMEALEDVELLNTVMQPERWTAELIEESLSGIALWHSTHLDQIRGLDIGYWNDDVPSRDYMKKMTPLWEALLINAELNLPHVYTKENVEILKNAIGMIPTYWEVLEKQPKTLIHNDFNPRNICFKNSGGSPRLCLYDWELATFHIPHYDLVEFLSFVLIPENYDQRLKYIEYYREELNRLTGKYEDKEEFQKLFSYAALDFGLHRLGMYMMAHSVSPYPFLERVINSYFDTLKQLKHLLP